MKFFRISSKALHFLYFFLKYQSAKIAFLFAHYHLGFNVVLNVKRNGNYLEFTQTGNKLPVSSIAVYKEEIRSVIKVLNEKDVSVISSNANTIVLNINGIILKVHTIFNIFTCYEIYLEKLYDVSMPNDENIIVDIGMNVGYATLFFASSNKVAHVYSYEPFTETFQEASDNIALNLQLINKITMYNYGVSNSSKTVEVPMMESGSSIASTSSIFVEHNKVISDKSIKVEVKDIIEILEEIIKMHPQQRIFLKVDCEGEEYGIMDRLNKHEYMKNIAGLFIEWHIKGPESIIKVLDENGFTSLHLPRVGVDSGMIYAFR